MPMCGCPQDRNALIPRALKHLCIAKDEPKSGSMDQQLVLQEQQLVQQRLYAILHAPRPVPVEIFIGTYSAYCKHKMPK